MARTLDELESLLKSRGMPCQRIQDRCLRTELPTKAYTSPKGDRTIAIHLAFDSTNDCLTIDTPWAFDSKRAAHKEAMLACLLSASAKTPLVKTQLDPTAGEVRLCVDCRCGRDGVETDAILKVLALIPEVADRWYPQIKNAMEKGFFDVGGSPRAVADERLAALARRAGGTNRIAALLAAMKRRGGGPPAGDDASAN